MRTLLAALAPLLVGVPLSAADNWPEFRGPHGNGHADATGLPVTWSESENVAWKSPVHDKGWSSPVVWGDQVWLTTATEDGRKQFALCFDAKSGAAVHDLLVFENENPDPVWQRYNSYASPTPVIEEGRVYLHFGTFGTACLDTRSGETVWTRRDLKCDHFRGPASSPVLHDGLLYLTFDGYDQQYVVALDRETGDTVWRKDRSIDYGTDDGDAKKAFSTPQVIESGGREQLVSPSAVATIAYDPKTGDELWTVRHGGMNAAARPLFEHGLVYITAGDGGDSLVAVRPGEGSLTADDVVWKSAKGPRRPSLLIVDDLLFIVNDQGVATCLDAATGDTIWQQRIGGSYYGSPVYADGRIYCFSREGTMPVIAASRDFKLLAENKLDSGCEASPAVVDNALFVRTQTHLYRIEKK